MKTRKQPPADEDPIVQEIHLIREKLAARFGYDVKRMCEYYRKHPRTDWPGGYADFSTPSGPKKKTVRPARASKRGKRKPAARKA